MSCDCSCNSPIKCPLDCPLGKQSILGTVRTHTEPILHCIISGELWLEFHLKHYRYWRLPNYKMDPGDHTKVELLSHGLDDRA